MSKFESDLQLTKEQRMANAKRKAQEEWNAVLKPPSDSSMMALNSAQQADIQDIIINATLLPAEPTNVLPDNGDGQPNLLSILQAAYGLDLLVPLWDDSDGDPGSNDIIEFLIGQDVVETMSIPYPIDPATWDGIFFIAPNFLPAHGSAFIWFRVTNDSVGNPNSSVPAIFTVDSRDPHLGNQPEAAQLPADLPNPGQITREYLENNEFVRITIPEQNDPKTGDLVSVYFGNSTTPLIQDMLIPAGGEFVVDLPSAAIMLLATGSHILEFIYIDRAGNRSRRSSPVSVQLIQESAPALLMPDVPAKPVNRLEAIAGVEVFADYDAPEVGDRIEFNWNGVIFGRVDAPTVSATVDFATINRFASPYSANVTYTVTRRGITTGPSPVNLVPVDLEIVGPEPEPGPGPINELLELLTVRAQGSAADNVITPADKGNDADITIRLYDGAAVGHVVRVYYGDSATVVAEKALDAADIATGTITGLTLLFARIDLIGNGNILSFYRIFKDETAENYQESLPTTVVVTVNNIQNLPPLVFSGRNVSLNIINCAHRPWELGVQVQITDTVNLGRDDIIFLEWAMRGRDAVIVPGTERTLRHQVTVTEATSGRVTLRMPADGEYWHLVTRGSIVAQWRLQKTNGVNGSSAQTTVNYNLVQPGATICGL